MTSLETPAAAGSSVNKTSSKPTTTDHPRVSGQHKATVAGPDSEPEPLRHASPGGVINA